MASHEILGGLVQVYRRGDGWFWQCARPLTRRNLFDTERSTSAGPARSSGERRKHKRNIEPSSPAGFSLSLARLWRPRRFL
jgi:hypothetical protein